MKRAAKAVETQGSSTHASCSSRRTARSTSSASTPAVVPRAPDSVPTGEEAEGGGEVAETVRVSSSSSTRRRCGVDDNEDEGLDETEADEQMEVESKIVNVLVTEADVDNVICFVCGSGDDEDNILLCDW